MVLPNLASVRAVDCSSISNQEMCNEIQNANISDEEKSYLLADIMSLTKNYPDYQLVEDWNSRISLTNAPNDVQKKNSGYIRNACVKIYAVMPSVKYDDTLFIDTNGKVLTGFNHDVQISSDRASGDCRTERRLIEDTGTVRVYVNNLLQGSEHTTPYSAQYLDNTPVNIKAEYTIQVRARIKHYRYVYEDNFGFRQRVCRYQNTENKIDRLTITDEIQATIHNPELSASFTVTDKYDNTTKGKFLVNENAVNTELLFEDSFFKQHDYVFSEITTLPLLNILVVKAERFSSTEEQNLAYRENSVTLKNTNGCTIKISSFFKKNILPCDLSFERPDFTVSTDKTVYKKGEPVQVIIEPAGEYTVEYADQHYTINGNVEIIAEFPSNKITVQRGDRVIETYIHVQNEEPLAAGFSIGVFGMLNYALIGLVKRYWGVVE